MVILPVNSLAMIRNISKLEFWKEIGLCGFWFHTVLWSFNTFYGKYCWALNTCGRLLASSTNTFSLLQSKSSKELPLITLLTQVTCLFQDFWQLIYFISATSALTTPLYFCCPHSPQLMEILLGQVCTWPIAQIRTKSADTEMTLHWRRCQKIYRFLWNSINQYLSILIYLSLPIYWYL